MKQWKCSNELIRMVQSLFEGVLLRKAGPFSDEALYHLGSEAARLSEELLYYYGQEVDPLLVKLATRRCQSIHLKTWPSMGATC